ncbi:MAG: hypothetical protein Q9217_002972 [Psora testacea]
MAPIFSRALLQPPELRSLLSSAINHLAERAPPSELLPPTKTLKPRSLASVLRRQQVTVTASTTANPIIPATYSGLNTGPSPGEVVGIVFGSVAGFLLLLWLIYTCFSMGASAVGQSSVVEEEVVVRRRSRSPRPSPSSHSRSEVIEESRTRERTRSRSRTPPRRESSRRETVIIEEIRRPSRPPPDDIVEVTEEHSPIRTSRRSSGRPSGYRNVDPDAFGGGNRPMRKVSRR